MEDAVQIKPGGRNMPWAVDAGPDYTHCCWCGIQTAYGKQDLCWHCSQIRKATKKAVDGICRGGCGKKLLFHALRCGECRRNDRWMPPPSYAMLDDMAEKYKRPANARGKKEAARYFEAMGIGNPFEEEAKGTWD